MPDQSQPTIEEEPANPAPASPRLRYVDDSGFPELRDVGIELPFQGTDRAAAQLARHLALGGRAVLVTRTDGTEDLYRPEWAGQRQPPYYRRQCPVCRRFRRTPDARTCRECWRPSDRNRKGLRASMEAYWRDRHGEAPLEAVDEAGE